MPSYLKLTVHSVERKQKNKPTRTESGEQQAILDFLLRLGWVVYRINSGAILKSYKNKVGIERMYRVNLAPEGTPDICGYIPASKSKSGFAMPVYIEVKRSGGKLRDAQKYFIDRAKSGGCFSAIGTFDDVKSILISHGYSK